MQSRTVKILLAVSIAANIFLIGGAIGAGIAGVRMFRDRMPGRPPAVWQATGALPEGERMMLRQALRDRALAAAPHIREARTARREAAELIARADYDPAAVQAALTRARVAEQQAREEVDTAVIAFLPKLTAEQRRALAEALVRGGRMGGPGGGPRRGGMGGGMGGPDAPRGFGAPPPPN
jgi:uncharacterized membrane protein